MTALINVARYSNISKDHYDIILWSWLKDYTCTAFNFDKKHNLCLLYSNLKGLTLVKADDRKSKASGFCPNPREINAELHSKSFPKKGWCFKGRAIFGIYLLISFSSRHRWSRKELQFSVSFQFQNLLPTCSNWRKEVVCVWWWSR